MAVVIRMKRTGRRNRPCYRIEVSDSRSPRDGRTLESLGLYDPIAPNPEAQVTMNVERAQHWLSVGALPSETVASLFKRTGVWEHRPIKAKRSRPGRKKTTKKRERREARETATVERKTARRTERVAARRAAAKAAAAAGAE